MVFTHHQRGLQFCKALKDEMLIKKTKRVDVFHGCAGKVMITTLKYEFLVLCEYKKRFLYIVYGVFCFSEIPSIHE